MTNKPFKIAGRTIGPGHPPYVIAELSANHNGSLERALDIMRACAEAGADAVKLQTYTADTITIDHDGPDFRIKGGLWDGRTLHDLYDEAHTPWEWHARLFEEGEKLGVDVFSSPFDATAIDFLEELGTPAFKISSFEAVDLPLIRSAAATGKPLIISTGMADLDQIMEARDAALSLGSGGLAMLHCVSGYPTPAEECNLATIPDLAKRTGCPVGLSDHTLGTEVAIAAISLGACIIEKHVTLHREDGGPDSAFSLEPEELAQLVSACRIASSAVGRPDYTIAESEKANAQFRRSLYVIEDIPEGELITERNVRSIRPGFGLEPKHYDSVLGARARHPLTRGTPLRWDMLTEIPG